MTKPDSAIKIEVFRSGTFKPMIGDPITYTPADLAGMASTYDFENAPAPIVIGHPSTDAPAFGWATGFEYDADADRLFANLGEVTPEFSEAVKAGHYKKVSLSLFRPDAPNNPTPGSWTPKHIGFLGAAAPAISGLANVAFADGDEKDLATFEAAFGEYGFEETASLFGGVRDWMIDKFGLETADKVIPSYRLEWLGDIEIRPPEAKPLSYAEPKDTSMTPAQIAAQEAAFKTREDKITADEASFAEAAQKRQAEDNASFAENLVATGKLLPASKGDLVALMNAVNADQIVAFSEGDDQPMIATLKKVMEAQPVMVDFKPVDLSGDPKDVSNVCKLRVGRQRSRSSPA